MKNTIYFFVFLFFPIVINAQNCCKVKSPKMEIYSQPDQNSLRKDVVYEKWSMLDILDKDEKWLKVKDGTGNVCYIYDEGNQLVYYQKDGTLLYQIANSSIFGVEMKFLIVYILIGLCLFWWLLVNLLPKFRTKSIWAIIFLALILSLSLFYILLCYKYYINNWLFDNLYVSMDVGLLYTLKNVLLQLWNIILYVFFIITLFQIFFAAVEYLQTFSSISWFDYTRRSKLEKYYRMVKLKKINDKLIWINVLLSILLPIVTLVLLIFSDIKFNSSRIGFFDFLIIGLSSIHDIMYFVASLLISLGVLSTLVSIMIFILVMKNKKLWAMAANLLYISFIIVVSVSITHSLLCLSGNNFFMGLFILITVLIFILVVITGLKEYRGSNDNSASSVSNPSGGGCYNCRWYMSGFGSPYCNRDSRPVKSGDWCQMHERY